MDGRKNNGAKQGENRGQGRKSKAEELSLIERLTPMQDDALKALEKGVKACEFPYIKLYMEYMYGKPKETVKFTGDLNVTNRPVLKFINGGDTDK
jgi:hypothetical protein